MPAISPRGNQPLPLVERLRAVHLQMVEAVLAGDGLERVAALASKPAGGPVAIVVPRLGPAAAAGAGDRGRDLEEVRRYVADRMTGRPATVPAAVAAEVPISAGDEVVGAVVLLRGASGGPGPEASEFLHLAAVAALTELAVADAKEEVESNLRASLLEDLRSREDMDPGEIVRRARRLGCDLAGGAVALCADLDTGRPRHVLATVAEEHSGALAQHLDGRVYALLPAAAGDALASARRLAGRLERHGPVGVSSMCPQPADLHRAIQEAELVLDVLRQSGAPIAQDIGSGTYRLLFRVLASHPEEVRSFFDETLAPAVRYDDQYRTDFVGTLEAYFSHNCNMNATAAAIYAHRHTVAYRLERIRDLTGLDPMLTEDRERLGLGLKAYRIIGERWR